MAKNKLQLVRRWSLLTRMLTGRARVGDDFSILLKADHNVAHYATAGVWFVPCQRQGLHMMAGLNAMRLLVSAVVPKFAKMVRVGRRGKSIVTLVSEVTIY